MTGCAAGDLCDWAFPAWQLHLQLHAVVLVRVVNLLLGRWLLVIDATCFMVWSGEWV